MKINRRGGDGSVGTRNTATQIMAFLLWRSNGVATLRSNGGACYSAGGGHFGRCSACNLLLQFVTLRRYYTLQHSVTAPCNAALLHLAARRYCNSQRSVALATLLQLAMQRCYCGAVAARSATLLWRCCSSQRNVATMALLQLAARRCCDALKMS